MGNNYKIAIKVETRNIVQLKKLYVELVSLDLKL